MSDKIFCKICNYCFNNISNLSMHISKKHKEINLEQYYNTFMNSPNFCPICNKLTMFKGLKKGYNKYCSTSCRNKSLENKNKIKNTNIKKYGVENVFQDKSIKEKLKKTNIEKHGVINPGSLKKFIEKRKNTCLLKYGVSSYSKTKEYKTKYKNIMLERYGNTGVLNSFELKKKVEQTNIQKYGYINPFYNKDIQLKIQKTNIKKYNVNNPSLNKEIIEKSNNTRLKNSYLKIINSDRIKDKFIPLFDVNKYIGTKKQKYLFKCKKCNKVFDGKLENGLTPRCTNCFPIKKSSSLIEQQISNYCKNILNNEEILLNDRNILEGKELDIYIPSHNLAIELHGLYWHSEISGNKNCKFHYNKYLKCSKKEIRLIQIYEDEWLNKQDIVKSIILNKLNLNDKKIYARDCEFVKVDKKDAKTFLYKNHIQDYINGEHYGLIYNSNLVSIITIGKPRFNKNYEYELLRYCNVLNTSVIGGLSKILTHVIKEKNIKSMITYSDLRYGEGKGYEKIGFKYEKISSPSFYYLFKYTNRINRLKFQKHKLDTLLENFDPNLTTWQNMQLNGYDRIWDCGCKVYSFILH